MTFLDEVEAAALAWKASTPTLPDDAREEGLYQDKGEPLEICLPVGAAALNLLPEAREWAIAYFRRAGIPWHHGISGNPGNHLLSSQVQCVNALAPMASDPMALKATFGRVLDIAEVLPFGDPIDERSYIAFEWIGLDDHLNEHPGKPGSRGANNTSADAAIRYRTSTDRVEVALIEWKFTERYAGQPLSGGGKSNAVRLGRYQALFADPESPVRIDLLGLEDLFREPVYQLLRLQLLAWRMERVGELGADAVRLVYAAPSRHEALWKSLTSKQTAVAESLQLFWPQMLRRPDRFVLFDTADLITDGSATTDEFKARYEPLSPPAEWAVASRAELEEAAHQAVEYASAVLLRVGTGVLQQALEPGELSSVSDPLLRELTARAEELAALAKRLRADQMFKVLHPDLS